MFRFAESIARLPSPQPPPAINGAEAERVMVAVAPVLPCQNQYLGLHKGQNGQWYRIHCISPHDPSSPSLLDSEKKSEILRQTALIINSLSKKTAVNHIVIEQGRVTVGSDSDQKEESSQVVDSQSVANYNNNTDGFYAIDENQTTLKDVAQAINHLLSSTDPYEQTVISPISSRGPSPVAISMIFSSYYYKKEDKKPREDSSSSPSSASLPLKQSSPLSAKEPKKNPTPVPHAHAPKIAPLPSSYPIPSLHDVGSSDEECFLDYMTDQLTD